MPLDSPQSDLSVAVQPRRAEQIRAAEIGLLYANAFIGIGVTAIASPVLAVFEWDVISHPVIVAWSVFMFAVTAARFWLTLRYKHAGPAVGQADGWGVAFAFAAAASAAGWGAAGILLYPADLTHQVLLVFVLGGMMLGGSSLLAPRPAAFLAFLLPTGLAPAVRLALDGDHGHLAMALLAVVFTTAAAVTTWRIHQAIETSLNLRFDKQDLLENLERAHQQTEELNEQLESKVEERTAALQLSNARLQDEIEQRARVEEELIRARKLESLGVLAGGIAHDFNNFLTIVQGNVQLAKLELNRDHPLQETFERTLTACQRAAFLASQLLTFAKGGAPVRRVVSVSKLIEDAVALARAGAPTSINIDIPDDLSPAEVDAGQIGQVLHNILLNARQAMAESGIIEVRARNAGDYVSITVRDYGCGISPEVLPRIFDPYFTTKPAGTGLGLATAYSIVSKHGGHISAESKPGVGTVFCLDLPRSTARIEPEARVTDVVRNGTGKLLVMDDEESIRKLLKGVLSNLGYQVETARDGAEAVALYEAAQAGGCGFDAVLLDLTVRSGMGGIEAAARLREVDHSARLIVSSGYSHAPVMSDFRRFGFDAVIPKPWTPSQMSEVFREVLATQPNRKSK